MKQSLRPENQRLVNNLLNIKGRDKNIFIKLNQKDTFDLHSLLTASAYNKIFNDETFSVKINKSESDNLLNKLEQANNFLEFTKGIDDYDIYIPQTKLKLLQQSFDENKVDVISKIKSDEKQFLAKWKRFKLKYLDLQVQTNSWPLYVGTFIVKLSIAGERKLYAPLLLKKVEVDISDNSVKINTLDGTVDINEKLLFFLNDEYGFKLAKPQAHMNYSFDFLIDNFKNQLKEYINEFPISLKQKVISCSASEVNNLDMEIYPGAIISTISPLGGILREKLIKILEADESLDNLLMTDPLKDIKTDLNKTILKGKSWYKICPTDISQEMAIAGSFLDHAIIWGPPGTGKSQTIANILVNLLYENKKVLVTSEKKAALDVIKERMGKLSKFMFFGLINKTSSKEEFYEPFKALISVLRDTQTFNFSHDNPQYIISSIEANFYNQSAKLSKENISNLIDCANAAKENNLDSNYIANNFAAVLDQKDILEKLSQNSSASSKKHLKSHLKELNIKKTGFLRKYPPAINNLIDIVDNVNYNYKLLLQLTTLNDITNLTSFSTYQENEINYHQYKNTFRSDVNFLEHTLAQRYREKLIQLQNHPQWTKKVNTFLRNCASGYRIPYKFISIHKEIIGYLYNIFISTPQTLANCINWNNNYDYAVFDEASQLHLEKALPFIAYSNRCIIAGDKQQMQPTSFFTVREEISSDIEDESEVSVDSLLEYADRKGLKPNREYMLTKNYRSNSAVLMNFSSKHFYNSQLDVIDKFNYSLNTPIEVFNVNGKWVNNQNDEEAVALLDKIIEVKEQFPKIIVLTLNLKQKLNLETMIFNIPKYKVILEWLLSGVILLRNLENIQGDEADCVIISVAYDKTARFGATYVARPAGRHALNVAISRAKSKLIVFKSLASKDIVSGNTDNKSIETLKSWISYLDESAEHRKNYLIDFKNEQSNNVVSKEGTYSTDGFESEFEVAVYEFLHKNINNRLVTQYVVGSYRIDIAVLSPDNRFLLGIEVDGYKYHSSSEKLLKDIERQRFIEAKGYPIYRVTEILWHTNKDKIINDINQLIKS